MYDLPTLTESDTKAYNKFHKFLVKSGFVMLQYSVYCKLALNASVAESIKASVRQFGVNRGNIQMLTVTEKQFAKMEFISGTRQTLILDTEDRLVIL